MRTIAVAIGVTAALAAASAAAQDAAPVRLAWNDHRETLWVCFRDPGPRRPVTEEECSTCPRWELDPNNRVNP